MIKQINIKQLPLCAEAIRNYYIDTFDARLTAKWFVEDWEETLQYLDDIIEYLTHNELLTPEIEAELFPFIFANNENYL